MTQKPFVATGSIVRHIWSSADTVLFIFAGAAAEFSLNKAVDWLYYTGKIPADPIGRLYSTVEYAKQIIFSEESAAIKAITAINAIHAGVEAQRQARIPDWAYRDVLFMLIDYTIRSFELLERKLTPAELDDIYEVFYRMGQHMHLKALPATYTEWLPERTAHMRQDLVYSQYTPHLFAQYKKHLGPFRNALMLRVQAVLLPTYPSQLLRMQPKSYIKGLLQLYKICRWARLNEAIGPFLLPEGKRKRSVV